MIEQDRIPVNIAEAEIPSKETVARVMALLDTIDEHRYPFDMSSWMGDNTIVEPEIGFCGTPACLAGHTLTNDYYVGPEILHYGGRVLMGTLRRLPEGHPLRSLLKEYDSEIDLYPDDELVTASFSRWAAKLLGLSHTASIRLFHQFLWPWEFDQAYKEAHNSKERLDVTRRRVQYWAEHGY